MPPEPSKAPFDIRTTEPPCFPASGALPHRRAGSNPFRPALSLPVARDAMPRRERNAVLLPRRLILVAATAAAAAATTTTTTVGRWTPGTASSISSSSTASTTTATTTTTTRERAPSGYLPIREEPTEVAPTPAHRRAWGVIPRSSISCGRRRGPESRYHPGRETSMEFAPLWVRARGGAVGKRAAGGKRLPQLGEDKEEERSGVDVDEDSSQTEGEEEEQEVVDDGAVEADHDDEEEDSGPEETTAEGGGGGSTATAAAATAGESAAAAEISVLETLDLKTVLPLAIKQGAFFLMARWLGKNLRPEVESQVRAARAIYTAYLIFSQGLCMYIRYLIWKRNDDTEMEVPPPAALKNLMQDAGKAGGAAPGAAGVEGDGGAASSLGPMLDKMMTSKIAVKKYDMKNIQGVRRTQFWASLFMCYTHLKRGMIKPMMLQVSFGLLSLLDSPLFHIYVLGRKAEGNLARPFKKQGLMASLSGPMEAMAAKAAAAEKRAAEAAQAEADKAKEDEAINSDEDDGGEMPGIEVLSDADEDRAAD